MLVQVGLCRTYSKTTLLVFPRGGSFLVTIGIVPPSAFSQMVIIPIRWTCGVLVVCSLKFSGKELKTVHNMSESKRVFRSTEPQSDLDNRTVRTLRKV